MSDALVTRLRAASAAYYNGGPPLMTDQEFDEAVDILRNQSPDHPFLQEIGAPPLASEETVQLPYPMPSLDKLKPGQDALTRFLANKGPFVVSEKLDGLSALWVSAKKGFYLRGNGLIGQNISRLTIKKSRGLSSHTETPAVIRGEIIAARPLTRSWVNGILHQKNPSADDLAKLHFIAYEVLEPAGMNRSRQLVWLQDSGFETPSWKQFQTTSEQELAELLQRQRGNGRYDTDGLVIGQDVWEAAASIHQKLRNPKTLFAFKMPLTDQSATTTVREILWAPSSQGYLIPRIQFEPVKIGGATIQFCTGHHARMVHDKVLGPDARIVIRRSGDVIPTLDHVVSPAPAGPSFPPEGSWTWADGFTHIRSTDTNTKENLIARLHHFCKTLGIPGTGAATTTALVEGGLSRPNQLLTASPERLAELLGPTNGPNFSNYLREGLAKATEATLWLASSKLPRGVGESKLQPLFAADPDPRNWTATAAVPGWSKQALETFLLTIPGYVSWRLEELSGIPFPVVTGAPAHAHSEQQATTSRQTICFSGFRDAAMEQRLVALGHTICQNVTAKTTLVVVPDEPHPVRDKERVAKEKGIPITTKSNLLLQ